MSATLDVHIDSIAAGGDGVGRHGGLVVFVPRTAPGDVARVIASKRDRFMRGKVIELLTRSELRVDPPCDHYVNDRCGGCQLQHLHYRAQLDAKSLIIRDAMTRIGGVSVEPPAVEPSDRAWRYRGKLTLAMRRRDGRWIAGLHRFDAPDEVFELRDCPITEERVLEAWGLVLGQQHLLPGAGELRGAIRVVPGGFAFSLEGGGAQSWRTHERFFAAVPELSELWWQPADRARRLLHSRGANDGTGASFSQVNSAVAAQLRRWIVGLAAKSQPRTAVDAYAGSGDIAVALAERGMRVTAIEIDRNAARVCAQRLPEGSRAIAAPVEQALPDALPADVVVLNPPRAGLDARVTDMLRAESRRALKAVLYISCNPATLARDLKRMDGYRVGSLRGFDMFPQTAHVETVCELVPAA